jgi:hypothetical protein
MKTSNELCLEACALGDEAIRIAIKANALIAADPMRWVLTGRMLEINARLKQITKEISHENHDRKHLEAH